MGAKSDRETSIITPAGETLDRLLQEEWDFRLQADPLFATYTGDHRWDDRLGSLSPADYENRAARIREFLARLEKMDRQGLPPAGRVNLDIILRDLHGRLDEIELGLIYTQTTKKTGPHLHLPDIAEIMPFQTVEDYEIYIARLADFRRYFDDLIELLQTGLSRGYAQPAVVLEGVEKTIQPHIVRSPGESLFIGPFRRFPAGFDRTAASRLTAAGEAAILSAVVPAYRTLLEFMQNRYIPAAREDIACSSFPGGRRMYENRIRWFTTLELTPQEVFDTGLEEVERIRGEMEEVKASTGFSGSLPQFFDFLHTADQFYAATPRELMKEVALIMKNIDGRLPRFFKNLPRMPYGIREAPAHRAPFSPSGYYFPSAGDGTSAGIYYVNTFDLRSRPLYEFPALSIHEAVPGHHLQRALQQELSGLPAMRRYYEAPAFEEGWALYCEHLGLEMGLYENPYDNFGRLIFEMWRAVRLVVDPGMHYFGWTRQQAVEFMGKYTALSPLNIENEINRYIAWPGQAVGYKIGELKIQALRQAAELALGNRFNLREFHNCLLHQGEVPMDVLTRTVEDWMAGETA